MGEINDGHKEISAFINIDNECKSDETRKKKKKKRKKSKSNKVHATYDDVLKFSCTSIFVSNFALVFCINIF
jgi:hypothetical protein